VILLDTSGLLAALDTSEGHHQAAASSLKQSGEPRVLSPFVLAELDYLLTRHVSARIARLFLREVAGGAYELAPFDADDVARAAVVLDRYGELDLGLTEASIVVLAERYRTIDVLTLDERHFRAITGPRNQPFRLLPADA
jgi:predicted nucleic acid-binding protein